MSLIGRAARLISAALAAAVVPTLWAAVLLFPEPTGAARSYDPFPPYIAFLAFTYALSVGLILLFGAPIFLLFRRYKTACFLTLALGGAVIGPAMFVFLHLLGGGLPSAILAGGNVAVLSQLGLTGALSAGIFWLVVRKAG